MSKERSKWLKSKERHEIISAIEKGATIQTGSTVDNSTQSSKEYGSPSGTKTLGTIYIASPTPPQPKGQSLFQEDIFPEPKDDSKKILGNSIKEMKQRGDAQQMFDTIYINGKKSWFFSTTPTFMKLKVKKMKD